MFRDRDQAGLKLAETFAARGIAAEVVLAIPRGGVSVALPLAQHLATPIDVVIVRKIGAPGDPEYAIGAVDPDGTVDVRAHGVADSYVRAAAARELEEIRRRERLYRGGRPAPELRGRSVVVVDDGVATGATALRALRYVRRAGAARVIFAAPVASSEAVESLSAEADEVVVLETPAFFASVSQAYGRFPQVEDAEVIAALESGWSPGQ
jgi:predicted phosphoribosyltransferase